MNLKEQIEKAEAELASAKAYLKELKDSCPHTEFKIVTDPGYDSLFGSVVQHYRVCLCCSKYIHFATTVSNES